MAGVGADTVANDIFDNVMEGVGVIDIPEVDFTGANFQLPDPAGLSSEIVRLTNADLTTGQIGGTGTFDVLMAGYKNYLQQEYDKNRITGEMYAKTFIALTEAAMAQGVQYLLGRDASYWAAVTAQQQALAAQAQTITARIEAETAKLKFATVQVEALRVRAEFALTKLKLATEDQTYGAAAYALENILPAQATMAREQAEAARAQTMNTRSDGITAITGSVGKQKDLYDQQITSYQRDSEVKAAKIFVDAWTVMKTIDEGLLPPSGFNNTTLDAILTTLKQVNGLD